MNPLQAKWPEYNTIDASMNLPTSQTHHTTCCYCGVGCGVTATTEDNQIVALSGDNTHPANYGKLCVKGASLHETQILTDRLTTPIVNGLPTSWDAALSHTAAEFKRIIDTHGPDAVAFYLSGQLLTEDYYVANKLMKGFLGTANVDTNSRLCMASAVVAHKRAFGEDIVPGCYEDLEQCNLLILVGSNMAYTHPVVYQRIVAAKKNHNMKVVVIDPRRTPTCDIADLHLPIRPGSDAFLFNGLLSYLASEQLVDSDYIARHCNGFDEALAAAQTDCQTVQDTAERCDIDLDAVQQFFAWYGSTFKTVTVFSQGINQSSSGVDKGNAIINCHLATGRIGHPGATPFSITGQPNAMGGREVGGLANQLAAHMNFGDEEALSRVQRFWNAPRMAQKEGLKAVDLFEAARSGKIKAIWIMATNPVVSMPNANAVREALRQCECVVVSECVANTDTAKEAHVLLPTTTWGEKVGTVTNSERCISLQSGFLHAPSAAKHDWEIITAFAQHLGFEKDFPYTSAHELFCEHAALSGFENNDSRAFDISAFEKISREDYLRLKPFQWPKRKDQNTSSTRLLSDGRFYTADRRAKLIAIHAQYPQQAANTHQVLLNTGRVRDQWHTMSRTGNITKLTRHTEEPFVEIRPDTAAQLFIAEGDIVELSNAQGRYKGRAVLSEKIRRREVFAPIHWNDRNASEARISALVLPITDPLCGQPEFKHSPVTLAKCEWAWQGVLLTTETLTPATDYWCQMPLANGFKYRLADVAMPQDWEVWLRGLYPQIEDWITHTDSGNQFFKAVGFHHGKLSVAFHFTGNTHPKAHEHAWLEQQLGHTITREDRLTVLAGSPLDAGADPGAIICSCFQVGEVAIREAIENGVCNAEQLGQALKCGTNCGSCIPELNALIESCKPPSVVEA